MSGHYELGREMGRGWHQQSDMGERGPLHDALIYKYSHGRPDCGWSSGSLECLPEEVLRVFSWLENGFLMFASCGHILRNESPGPSAQPLVGSGDRTFLQSYS